MDFITPILLAGGSGSRLWPLSRKTYPKQFTKLNSNKTLFQQSALRFINSDLLQFKPHITITNSLFRFVVTEQLQSVGIDPGQILIEPEAKNTAPAIIAATILAHKENKHSILISTPSDHVIPDVTYFNKIILSGINQVNKGKIVTFGINPSYPETGYGYLKLEKSNEHFLEQVVRFVEKPNKDLAKKMFDDGNYLWNSGIFMFRAQDMISAFNSFAKDILSKVSKSLEHGIVDMGFLRLDPAYWSELEDISIDYAIMEKAKNLVAIPYSSSWSDLGNWDSVWRETEKDKFGVGLSKNAYSIECEDTLLRSENKSQQIVGLGLKNIIAIAMQDAVLVANKSMSQDVKKVVKNLKSKNIPQSEMFPKEHRPWGWFERLTSGECFQVKIIVVKSGAALSLQSHKFRSEHWVVVKGLAKITIDKEVKYINEGQSTYVPLGRVHRLENPGKEPIIIIEVQIGSYLGEDDIIRYKDNYSRK